MIGFPYGNEPTRSQQKKSYLIQFYRYLNLQFWGTSCPRPSPRSCRPSCRKACTSWNTGRPPQLPRNLILFSLWNEKHFQGFQTQILCRRNATKRFNCKDNSSVTSHCFYVGINAHIHLQLWTKKMQRRHDNVAYPLLSAAKVFYDILFSAINFLKINQI